MKKKKYKTNGLRVYRSYTIQELAIIMSTHEATIRRLIKQKRLLPIAGSSCPYLFYGQDVRDFVRKNNKQGKCKTKPEQGYCLKCACAVNLEDTNFEIKNNKLGKNGLPMIIMIGNCKKCGTKVFKFISQEIYKKLKGVI